MQKDKIKVRGFESNKGTIKSEKNMKGKYCLQPFTNVDIHSNCGVRCCSESWMPAWIGELKDKTIKDIWNSETTQKIRESILDGSYSYCDWHQCPFYSNENYYLFTREELEHPEKLTGVRRDRVEKHKPWIQYILDGKTKVDIPPANYNLAYDETCNLKCPSCRSHSRVYVEGEEYEKRYEIHKKVINELMDNGMDCIGRLNVTGSGEPFISKIFSDFLFTFDGTQYPNLDINIQSNGVLFTPEAWEKMEKIHGNVNEVIISIDAACAETYSQIRVNGDYERLLSNIRFLSGLRKEKKINRLMLAFVVQRKNYKEMVDAIKIGKELGVDLFIFNLLNNWWSWSIEEYERNAIWKQYNPEYKEFLEVLRDPIFDDPMIDLGNMMEYRKEAMKAD
ncbi:radical SAM protein [[Clostridium] polysaccharolyticum]|uniref:4Fe-4S single cluster domain-containing protein n=1 Tax=[Clostridium] polysaccharolyticum TaxID=29364 RepID=A0A1I0CQY4_9FIRM|nr:radical SAM protein [[Clostridium] polysaccharolyticum]SET21925.1 4Fe-4S single cluster domain-containing protein [[Clostridium] polysaccharolyticum]